jgi:hypothetical protein
VIANETQVTRRYAEFVTAIHILNPEGNQTIATRLAALRTQMQKLMLRLAAPLQALPKTPPLRCKQKQVIFLINNMDQIISVLRVSEKRVVGPADTTTEQELGCRRCAKVEGLS